MSFTPEGRQKALATKARKKAERLAAAAKAGQSPVDEVISKKIASEALAEFPQTLADLGLAAEPEDDFRLDDILSNEEIEAIRAKAREDVAKERKKARARSFLDLATEEARREYGMVPADEARQRELEEMTEIRITLPRLRTPPPNSRDIPPDPIILDQRLFSHGRTYQVTRAQYEYIMDLQHKAWMHMAQVEGRSRTYYSDTLGTMVHQGGIAYGGPSGPSFDAIHRRPAA